MIALPPGFYDPENYRVVGPLGQRHFTKSMHEILMTLAEARGRIVTHDNITERLWPVPADEPETIDNCIKVHMARMREAMRRVGLNDKMIRTQHHIGYCLEAPPMTAITVTVHDKIAIRKLLATHPDRKQAMSLLNRVFD